MCKYLRFIIFLIPLAIVGGFLLYQLPPIKSRLEYRLILWNAQIKHWLFPPEEQIFLPQIPLDETTPDPTQVAEIAMMVSATLQALIPTETSSPTPGPTLPPTNTPTPTFTSTPTLTPTPIPTSLQLSGIRHEYEQWNNCGPATLGMQLSYWGWKGDQRDTAAFLKPNPRDKNVSPYELVAYVETQTDFRALVRAGGNLILLKSLIAAGFPVIVEKTLGVPGTDGWIGHYALVSGYNDDTQRFVTQDSYIMADFPVSYDDLLNHWNSFNYTLIVVYSVDQEINLFNALGKYKDASESYLIAAEKAREEINNQIGLPLFFAWFNLGTSLTSLDDFTGAAQAYDQAFLIYASLNPDLRPWRMVWYQHGPYQAYYENQRYQDIINLANTTLVAMGEQTVEETFYWRGLAYAALGNLPSAKDDLEQAVSLNINYQAAQDALAILNEGG